MPLGAANAEDELELTATAAEVPVELPVLVLEPVPVVLDVTDVVAPKLVDGTLVLTT